VFDTSRFGPIGTPSQEDFTRHGEIEISGIMISGLNVQLIAQN
jgi:hypothetical protein